jgi:hypothetical protein
MCNDFIEILLNNKSKSSENLEVRLARRGRFAGRKQGIWNSVAMNASTVRRVHGGNA